MTDRDKALELARSVLATQAQIGVEYPSEMTAGELARALLAAEERCERMEAERDGALIHLDRAIDENMAEPAKSRPMSDPIIAEARNALKRDPPLVDLDDPSDPYPADVLGLFARAFVALDKESDDLGRASLFAHATYKKRRNEQFAAYERQRWATVAFLLDRAENYSNSSGYRALFDELVEAIAEWRHVQCAEAGEYDDMRKRIDRILAKRATP